MDKHFLSASIVALAWGLLHMLLMVINGGNVYASASACFGFGAAFGFAAAAWVTR